MLDWWQHHVYTMGSTNGLTLHGAGRAQSGAGDAPRHLRVPATPQAEMKNPGKPNVMNAEARNTADDKTRLP